MFWIFKSKCTWVREYAWVRPWQTFALSPASWYKYMQKACRQFWKIFDFEIELIHQIKQYERGVIYHYKWRHIDDVAINDVTCSRKSIWRVFRYTQFLKMNVVITFSCISTMFCDFGSIKHYLAFGENPSYPTSRRDPYFLQRSWISQKNMLIPTDAECVCMSVLHHF